MQMLLGSTRDPKYLRRMRELGWGRLFAAEIPKPSAGEAWALDNGVFSAWKNGLPYDPQPFRWALFRAARAVSVGRDAMPEFIVLPDIVADASSLAFSLQWLRENAGLYEMAAPLPWFLVLQNGMDPGEIRSVLEQTPAIAGLFLGGDDAFKLTAPAWCELAHAAGRRFHFGRASTIDRLRAAHDMGADSCDTTQPLWDTKAFDRFERAWLELYAPPAQTTLFGESA